MPLKLKLVIIFLSIIFLIYIYYSIKKKNISVKYSLSWMTACFLVIIIALIPDYLIKIANLFGIEKLSNMMFLFAFIILFFIVYTLTLIVSKQKQQIIILTQELGILKNKIDN